MSSRVPLVLLVVLAVRPALAENEKTAPLVGRLDDKKKAVRLEVWSKDQAKLEETLTALYQEFKGELLDDPAPLVRQTAHQALVRFARGADHGPFGASPTKDQVRTAQKSWRAYIEMQDTPTD